MPSTNSDVAARGETGTIDASEHAAKIRPFDRALPIKMLRAREVMMQRFRPLMHAKSVTDQQWRIMRALADRGSAEILDLAETCVIHPASLSRILPKMEEAGYITRRTNEADKRRIIVTLTDHGSAFVDSFGPQTEAVYASIARDIGPERMQELYDLLDHMIEALKAPGKEEFE
ncbi:homoprotocatechuate degradation operon regulator HpaR [Microbaculum marinum]|uniref:Homoprotocatechuate degradation operon regulator HpaR n=1 Tax=Microbaculum marinum TaxID=1764581 RepID=A0AAW9RIV9_9HYPH